MMGPITVAASLGSPTCRLGVPFDEATDEAIMEPDRSQMSRLMAMQI